MGNTSNKNQWLIEIGQDDRYWAAHLERVPNMICIAYRNLRELAGSGNVYGSMLQCKDIFELVCKTPVIMALIYLEGDRSTEDADDLLDIIKLCLDVPMTMGSWHALAGIIVKKQRYIHLPESIYQVLKKTRTLYQQKISSSASDVINWRNSTIGHGVLKFEDDDSYREEMTCLLTLLREYFNGQKRYSITGLYDDLYFFQGQNCLTGEYWPDEITEAEVQLSFDGRRTDTTNFIVNQKNKYYLFDAFFKTKNIAKYSSYIDGHSIVETNSYFAYLANRLRISQKSIASVYITREEERVLELLNAPADYVEPEWLAVELEKQMEELGRGIITVFMERGTGKSAFANQMNGLYHPASMIPASFTRSYPLQNAALRGPGDFVNAINFGFRHSSNADNDLFGSQEELPVLSLKDADKARSLASFLNVYHRIYGKDYTVLILDGVDELTPDTGDIMNFVPAGEVLDEGVFIVLLSRFKDEKTVIGQSKEYIRRAESMADRMISLERKSESNRAVLEAYIRRNAPRIDQRRIHELVLKADYRILYLKAILSVGEDHAFDHTNETGFISSFLAYVTSFYGVNQRTKIEEIAVVIALFPDLSLNEYKRYIACQEITYEFVGLFNDLLPLMTVTHRDGITCYAFADKAYDEYVLTRYPETVQTVIDRLYLSFAEDLDIYLKNDGFREFENAPGFNKSKLNEDIVFYAKHLIELWRKAPRQCMIADVRIPEKHILKLYTSMEADESAAFGLGAYLRDTLRDIIIMNLYHSLRTKDDIATQWADNILDHIEHPYDYSYGEKLSSYFFLSEFLSASSLVDKYLLDYMIDHIKDIKEPERWFWVLVRRCSRRAADAIVYSSKVADFIDYVLQHSPGYGEMWFTLLLDYNISEDLKERMTNELEEPSYIEKSDRDVYSEILEKAISLFEDYTVPIKDDMGDIDDTNDGPVYRIFDALEKQGNRLSALLGANNLDRLYAAFIHRLNYERERGTFKSFICELYHLGEHALGDIFEQYYGEDWPEKGMEILPDLFNIEEHEYNFATGMLVDLVTRIAGWLDENKRFAEETAVLQNLIKGTDGRHFLVRHTVPIHHEALLSSGGWGTAVVCYPSDNALYLLKLLDRSGYRDNIKPLLEAMEASCSIVDKALYKDQKLRIAHEIQKYRFLQVRKSLEYRSSFDVEVESLVQSHRAYVYKELESLSDTSAFLQIHLETELLLEYAWQLERWNTGIAECEGILDMLSKIEKREHSNVTAQSIQVLRDKTERCRSIFMFMGGGTEHMDLANSNTDLLTAYNQPRHSLFFCIDRIFEDEAVPDSEKLEKILDESKIQLRYY